MEGNFENVINFLTPMKAKFETHYKDMVFEMKKELFIELIISSEPDAQ